MKNNNMAQNLLKARFILLIQFVVIALIIGAAAANYGLQTQQWSTAINAVFLLLAGLMLYMLAIYSRAKQLLTAFSDDLHSVEQVETQDKKMAHPDPLAAWLELRHI